MQHGVADELLQRRQGIRLAPLLERAGRKVDGGPVVRDQLVVDSPKDVLKRSVDQELVDDGIAQRISRDPKKLNVGAGEKVAWAIAEYQNAHHRGSGSVG